VVDGGAEEVVGLDDDPLPVPDGAVDDERLSVGIEGVSIVRDADWDTAGARAADPGMAALHPTSTISAATAPASAPLLIARR
jgi:hypothetical protein